MSAGVFARNRSRIAKKRKNRLASIMPWAENRLARSQFRCFLPLILAIILFLSHPCCWSVARLWVCCLSSVSCCISQRFASRTLNFPQFLGVFTRKGWCLGSLLWHDLVGCGPLLICPFFRSISSFPGISRCICHVPAGVLRIGLFAPKPAVSE